MEYSINHDLTEKQLRGLDLIVKGTSKKFPFINGWSLADDYRNYRATLYIDLYIDYPKMAEFLGYKIHSSVMKRYLDGKLELSSSSLSPFLATLEDEYPLWGEEKQTEIFEAGYELHVKIKEMLNKLYNNLPDDYVLTYETTFSTTETKHSFTTTVGIGINNYIQNK